MKNVLKLSITFSLTLLYIACQNNQQTLNTKQNYNAVGVVKKVDPESGKITIDHEDIAGYMSAMQMTESVSEKSVLENVKAGDQVSFEIERNGAKLVITKITKIGETEIINGGGIYKTNCAECHGMNGEGEKQGIPLISGHALNHSEAEYIEQVKNGKDKKMPAFRDKLTEAEIKEVVRFVREELQKNADRGEHKH